MIGLDELERILGRIDGRGYKQYRVLRGEKIVFRDIKFGFTRIQPDPYAPPSIIEAVIPYRIHWVNPDRYSLVERVAIRDYLYRKLYRLLVKHRVKCGTGRSCFLGIPKPSNAIIDRSAVEFKGRDIVARFYVGLPSRGRRILGLEAKRLLAEKIPSILGSFADTSRDRLDIDKWIKQIRDYYYLRRIIEEKKYVAFIGENSILPRESSLSEKPLENAVPFKPPGKLSIKVKLPSGRVVKGMIIPCGLTVITGAGYHGKTTLLEAIQSGIYPHIPGDGREYVVSRGRTVSIKAEDGRIIHHVDISPHISNLPSGIDTSDFSTMDASGSTSMAASISEAVEIGAETLLVDEDTSATNLLFKDRFMEKIIREETITTLAENIRDMIGKTGVNVVLVSGSSSVFLPLADKIILLEKYTPYIVEDVDEEIRKHYLAPQKKYIIPKKRVFKGIERLERIRVKGLNMYFRYRDGKIFELNLRDNPRIIEESQARMAARIIEWLVRNGVSGEVSRIAEHINKVFAEKGYRGFIKGPIPPDLAFIDGIDIVWILSRIPGSIFTVKKN